MMWQGIDKRRFPRASYPCKVILLSSDLKETFSTHTENIGVGGIRVILPKELPKFCAVEILLYLKNNEGPLECSGRIIWSVQKDRTFDTGVEFIALREIDRLIIERIIEGCLRKQT